MHQKMASPLAVSRVSSSSHKEWVCFQQRTGLFFQTRRDKEVSSYYSLLSDQLHRAVKTLLVSTSVLSGKDRFLQRRRTVCIKEVMKEGVP